ncbi:diacylglycerol kinase (ATP) [Arthrobacter sp. JUb119]|uniref:diacylglycerol/lipid kinase family protein n=1 Tax=Micrococcaceae TaxID=1268 RepID=UPI0014151EBD|nr:MULTISPECIES: diacylglycerol kinase family protein [unclassified Arthrobacter]MCS3491380.1 diacylglycerol kinase (ATP) [Arthrobacter sp. JUb119]
MSSFGRTAEIRIIFHPASGRGRGMRLAQQLAHALGKLGLEHGLVDTSRTSVELVGDQLRASRAIVIIGGDGLIHHCIQHVAGTSIPIGVIPAGSGNDFWRMTGDANAEESLAKVIAFCKQPGATMPIDVLELRFDQAGRTPRYALGAVSWGFEATVNAKANALPRQLGALRYIAGLILCLPQLRGCPSGVRADGLRFSGSVLAASVANIKSLGGGIKLFPHADFTDGTAELAIVRGPNILRVLPYLARILTGAPHPWKVSANLTRARIETSRDSYADGECMGAGSFELAVIPAGIQLIS